MAETSVVDINPAQAYWNQRHALATHREQILRLIGAVDYTNDLRHFQWAQLISFALEFKPDLILELGRGMGNSTCAFTQVANSLSEKCRVVSICWSEEWDKLIKFRVEKVTSPGWFEPLEIVTGNILTYDYEALLVDARRIFLFWDAHGFEVAECVLGRILPLLQSKQHVVVMHDLSDARYGEPNINSYQHRRFWQGQSFDRAPLRLGNIVSWVAQSIAILDFSTRNEISLDSADHSYHTMFDNNVQKYTEMVNTLGEFFATQAHWFWFSLSGKNQLTFPLFVPPQPEMPVRQSTALSPLVSEVPAHATEKPSTDKSLVSEIPSTELLKIIARRALRRAKKVFKSDT